MSRCACGVQTLSHEVICLQCGKSVRQPTGIVAPQQLRPNPPQAARKHELGPPDCSTSCKHHQGNLVLKVLPQSRMGYSRSGNGVQQAERSHHPWHSWRMLTVQGWKPPCSRPPHHPMKEAQHIRTSHSFPHHQMSFEECPTRPKYRGCQAVHTFL